MPPVHGKNTRLFMGAHNMGRHMTSASTGSERDTAETTVFEQDWKTYVPGHRDATISGEGVTDTDIAQGIKATLDTNDRQVWQHYPTGDAAGALGIGM